MTFILTARLIQAKSRETGYDPETGTNWCHLPMEMRAECLKHMNFQSIINLRATSKTENALVWSRKTPIKQVNLEYDLAKSGNDRLRVSMERKDNDHISIHTSESHRKTLIFLESILNFGAIDTFLFWSRMRRADGLKFVLDDWLGCHYPIKVRTLRLNYDFVSTLRDFLSHFESAERVSLLCNKRIGANGINLKTFVKMPVIAKARHLCILALTNQTNIHEHINNWIDNDSDSGRIFQFMNVAKTGGNMAIFEKEFKNRIIKQTFFYYRIRTNNDAKHMLVLFNFDDFLEIMGGVIPASMLETEEAQFLDDIQIPGYEMEN